MKRRQNWAYNTKPRRRFSSEMGAKSGRLRISTSPFRLCKARYRNHRSKWHTFKGKGLLTPFLSSPTTYEYAGRDVNECILSAFFLRRLLFDSLPDLAPQSYK